MEIEKIEELLNNLTKIDFEDIASVPQEEQHQFVEHVESLQDQLIKLLKYQHINKCITSLIRTS